jgi:hypothetical protein
MVLHRAGLQLEPLPGAQSVPLQKGASLWVYSDNDFVSQQIRNSGNWEAPESNQMTWALQQYRPQVGVHAAMLTAPPTMCVALVAFATLLW